jgi:hypothetical protein
MSQVIRDAGYALSDAEAAYLDNDQNVQVQYAAPLFRVLTLAGPASGLPDAAARVTIEDALQQITRLDPTSAPQPPASMQRLGELTLEHRAAIRRAAAAWLAGLQAGDPNWRESGMSDFNAAQQSLGSWQQEIVTRFPPPAQP